MNDHSSKMINWSLISLFFFFVFFAQAQDLKKRNAMNHRCFCNVALRIKLGTIFKKMEILFKKNKTKLSIQPEKN